MQEEVRESLVEFDRDGSGSLELGEFITMFGRSEHLKVPSHYTLSLDPLTVT